MKAFSLIELLVVITIFAIMATLTLPAISSINSAGGITRAGQILGDQIILARQEAANKNRNVEVRIIELTNGLDVGFSAVQLWIADESGSMSPIGRLTRLPEGVHVPSDPTLSPLLNNIPTSSSTNFPSLGVRNYGGFRIRSGGKPDSSLTTNNNFLTVQSTRDSNGLGDNFYTVRINPITGRLTIHRP